jgi:hypothetical protein
MSRNEREKGFGQARLYVRNQLPLESSGHAEPAALLVQIFFLPVDLRIVRVLSGPLSKISVRSPTGTLAG